MRILMLALSLAGLLVGLGGAARSTPKPAPCTCAEQQYCKPLATPASEFEVYPFVIPSTWKDDAAGASDNLTADWFE
jgi:hypothetical protein